jgi:ABC-type multidrug transport system ATPase subunit
VNELLTVEGLGKRFKDRRVLEDISFSVRPGEGLGLIWPNAAGKTTLFKCLAGLLAADTGTDSVNYFDDNYFDDFTVAAADRQPINREAVSKLNAL